MRHTFAVLALATAVPALAPAQVVPIRTLAKADAEWSEPFSDIAGVRELKSGGVVIADRKDKTIQLVDFKGAAKKVGREGSGPAEYGLPLRVFAAPGDTTWVFDPLNSRYLVIDPAGKAVSTFIMDNPPSAIPDGPGGGRGRVSVGAGFAEGIDAQGRLYFRQPQIRFGESAATVDTTPVLRWTRKTGKFDTVGVLLAPASPAAVQRGGPGGGEVRVSVRMGSATPFASTDAYAVTAAGDVAVVRARDYHVDWIVGGRTVSGAPVRYDRVKVTEADKTAWAEARKNATGIMVTNDNGNRSVRSGPPPQDGPPPTFPEFKGPFANSVVAAPDGRLWVQKQMPHDAPPTYDVFDNTGKVVQRVVLPKKTRLLGFGAGTVYLARVDEDDLQYLQRYRW